MSVTHTLRMYICILLLGCVNFLFFLKTSNSVDIVLKMHLAYGISHTNFANPKNKKFFGLARNE